MSLAAPHQKPVIAAKDRQERKKEPRIGQRMNANMKTNRRWTQIYADGSSASHRPTVKSGLFQRSKNAASRKNSITNQERDRSSTPNLCTSACICGCSPLLTFIRPPTNSSVGATYL
jgi:hypothetical protein